MNLKEIAAPLQDDLRALEQFIASDLKSRVPFVQQVVEYVIANGGKRLRPLLTVLCARLSGYTGSDSIRVGAAIEYMHTASLLHDDVLDNANVRRKNPTANAKWGNTVSVLAGDFFYCRAMDILVEQGSLKVLRVVTDAVTHTTEGEILEIVKSHDFNLTQDHYLQIISGKTAALIAAACEAGGILSEANAEAQEHLHHFGYNLGIAFQLMDDVLDYTSPTEELGKETGTDLKEGKITLPLILALNRADTEEQGVLKNALSADTLTPSLLSRVCEILKDKGAIDEAIKLANAYLDKARKNLGAFPASPAKASLLSITDYVTLRKN